MVGGLHSNREENPKTGDKIEQGTLTYGADEAQQEVKPRDETEHEAAANLPVVVCWTPQRTAGHDDDAVEVSVSLFRVWDGWSSTISSSCSSSSTTATTVLLA